MVRERYFNRMGANQWYLWGAFTLRLTRSGQKGIKFTNSSQRLVQLVKRQLQSHHKVQSSKRRQSYWVDISTAPALRQLFEDAQLLGTRSDRPFRTPPAKYEQNYVRGLIDCTGPNINGKITQRITWGDEQINQLYDLLQRNTQISCNLPKGKSLILGKDNLIRIRDWLYNSPGLYIDEVKSLLYSPDIQKRRTGPHPNHLHRLERITKILPLVDWCSGTELAGHSDYKHSSAFFRAFKEVTSVRPSELRRANGKEYARITTAVLQELESLIS